MSDTPETDAWLARIIAIRQAKGLDEPVNPLFWAMVDDKRNLERLERQYQRKAKNAKIKELHKWLEV